MTRRALVLRLLREAGPDRGVTTAELLQAGCGSRYGARILELRQAGHVIETERIREGSYRYRLTREFGIERSQDTDLDGGPAALTGSSASIDHGPDPAPSPPGGAPQDPPALFEVPPPAPRSALLEEDQAA